MEKYFKIKKGRKSEIVKAENMPAIHKYCIDNGYSGWEFLGMMSRAELAKNKKECRSI